MATLLTTVLSKIRYCSDNSLLVVAPHATDWNANWNSFVAFVPPSLCGLMFSLLRALSCLSFRVVISFQCLFSRRAGITTLEVNVVKALAGNVLLPLAYLLTTFSRHGWCRHLISYRREERFLCGPRGFFLRTRCERGAVGRAGGAGDRVGWAVEWGADLDRLEPVGGVFHVVLG